MATDFTKIEPDNMDQAVAHCVERYRQEKLTMETMHACALMQSNPDRFYQRLDDVLFELEQMEE